MLSYVEISSIFFYRLMIWVGELASFIFLIKLPSFEAEIYWDVTVRALRVLVEPLGC